MSIKSLIAKIESVMEEAGVGDALVERENMSEGLVYRDVVRAVLGVVTENSPPGCTGIEFGRGLHFALSSTIEEADLDPATMTETAISYLSEIIAVLENVDDEPAEADVDTEE